MRVKLLIVGAVGSLLLACGGSSSTLGVEQPVHAQSHSANGGVVDLKCWRMTDDSGRPTILYQQFGADPHPNTNNPAERDCLRAELQARYKQQPDGFWVGR